MVDFKPDQAFRDPGGCLVLCDRSFDLGSPFMHDYTYYSQMFEFEDVKGTDVLYEGKSYKLDENDPVWQKVKYTHIGETDEILKAEINNFYKDNGEAVDQNMSFNLILEKS